jgi:hypothetical protein
MSELGQISVPGSVRLGERLDLVQYLENAPSRPSWGGPGGGSINPADVWVMTPPRDGPGMQRLSYRLEPAGEQMVLSGEDLKTGHLILGSPGSGKTVLVMHLVRQVLALNRHDPKLRYGALILDPKATLVAPVRRLMADAGRERDLRIINPSILDRAGESVNLIDARMNPAELAKALVLSARAARAVDVSDQFWSLSWGNVFAAALILLRWYDERPVTLCRLLDALSPGREARREIEHIADEAERAADLLPRGSYRELSTAVGDIRRFYHADYVGTVEEIIKAAYGRFQGPGLEMFSVAAKGGPGTRPLYDDIIDNGRVVLVSMPPGDPQLARTLCTLIKCLFQITVLGRKERVLRGSAGLTNLTRPLLIACDEFGEVATELPAEPVGDGHFFALAREAGCMGILGLQGISTLEKAVRQSCPRSRRRRAPSCCRPATTRPWS